MPVFLEHSTASWDDNVLPSLARPLPRLSPLPPSPQGREQENYEVLVIGAGPAGLFLTLLLSRYGLKDTSLLCIDAKSATTKTGQADGIGMRTQEVFKTLGIVDEIRNCGTQFAERTVWSIPAGAQVIKRESLDYPLLAPSRYATTVTLHQGRIERILQEDLAKYSARGVERSSHLVDIILDEEGNMKFPIVAKIAHEGQERTVRAKYLVGADGAHSVVRHLMKIRMEGDSVDDIWGVLDFVVDTDFPDIRRVANLTNKHGKQLLQIPRERKNTGEYLTRMYVQIQAETKKTDVTAESILHQAQDIYHPYRIALKEGTEVEWWAAYQVGQRVAERFVQKDSKGIPRMFIVGDACHTHSPKVGQGMNVSMMDSYNLSWKLMYALHGLSPDPGPLLDTYELERRENALNLIDLDKRWYASRYNGSGKSPSKTEFIAEVISFFSGCGIEDPAGMLVQRETNSEGSRGPINSSDYTSGAWREGRRILDVVTTRYADGCPRHIHDDLLSDGRFRVVVLASTDLLDGKGQSVFTLVQLCTELLPQFPPSSVELVILQPLDGYSFEWTDLPACIKKEAEMRFHNADNKVYITYGVDRTKGAMAVIRPDGCVGTIADLGDVTRVEAYLQRCLNVIA